MLEKHACICDALLRTVLLRSWHQIALLQLRPSALIITQNVDSFEGGRSRPALGNHDPLQFFQPLRPVIFGKLGPRLPSQQPHGLQDYLAFVPNSAVVRAIMCLAIFQVTEDQFLDGNAARIYWQ